MGDKAKKVKKRAAPRLRAVPQSQEYIARDEAERLVSAGVANLEKVVKTEIGALKQLLELKFKHLDEHRSDDLARIAEVEEEQKAQGLRWKVAAAVGAGTSAGFSVATAVVLFLLKVIHL